MLEQLELSRLQLACVCPEFRYTEKISPLNIDKLNINPTSFTINGTHYKLGVIRHYTGVPLPGWVQYRNAEGGSSYDVGKFEEPRFRGSQLQTKEEISEREMRHFECEQKLLKLTLMLGRLETGKKLRPAELKRKKKIEEELEIDWSRTHFYNEYSLNYLQLTITSKNGTKLIERMKYDRPIRESMDYFIKKFLLGDRSHLNVDTLQFDYLPEFGDFKFRAKHLKIGYVDRVKAQNSLDEIACPLESKEVRERQFFMDPRFEAYSPHPFWEL
ncbi:hypothetical protein CRE_14568 [Caenorhabditis remanei]|uniref:Uncharacterized protein n=1 Tax=Caenorhabditis remanei TaxID=31234 RepID=E3M9K2_CAERE|nr:hypothetical protein CRE_14568 [Caenorhabditis remanei]